MDIRGKRGSRRYDADLLLRLADARSSGRAVSKKEIKDILQDVASDINEEYSYRTTTRGLTGKNGVEGAVRNTLADAVKDGWIKSASAKGEVDAFLKGAASEHGSLKHTLHAVKDMVADYRASRGASWRSGGTSGT